MIHFVHPELLWLLALIPVRAIWKGKRGQAVAVRYSTASNARRLAGARKTRAGQWVYGFVIGALTVFLRTFSNFAEGIMFSVLLMNAFVPILDRAVRNVRSPRPMSLKVGAG